MIRSWSRTKGPTRRKIEMARGKAVRIQRKARTGKYGVALKADRTRLGVLYDSKLEMRYAEQLDLLRHALNPKDRVTDVRRQVSIPLEVEGCLICHYRVDFEVIYADGRVELVEVKGLETPEWRLKYKLFKALYPSQAFRIVRKV